MSAFMLATVLLGAALLCAGANGQPSGPAGELTYEENLRINPPPPQNVRVFNASGTSIQLAWDMPPPVAVPHAYGDAVLAYRVYRKTLDELEFSPFAETTEQAFDDTSVEPGVTYLYAVSSIHESSVEGTVSDPPAVAVVLPGQ